MIYNLFRVANVEHIGVETVGLWLNLSLPQLVKPAAVPLADTHVVSLLLVVEFHFEVRVGIRNHSLHKSAYGLYRIVIVVAKRKLEVEEALLEEVYIPEAVNVNKRLYDGS